MVDWSTALTCVVCWVGFGLAGAAVFFVILPYISTEGCED